MKKNDNERDECLALVPDYALKKIIGQNVDIRKIFSPEKIKACQDIINNARDEFFEEELPKVKELKQIVKNKEPSNFSQIISICYNIKTQAKIFGFSFISNLCEQIIAYAEAISKPPALRFEVISKFVEALDVAVSNKMRDTGGILEKELNLLVADLIAQAE